MELKEIIGLIVLLLLSPLLFYLREQAYRSTHGNSTIREDIESLFQSFKEWRRERALRKKYRHLNQKKK